MISRIENKFNSSSVSKSEVLERRLDNRLKMRRDFVSEYLEKRKSDLEPEEGEVIGEQFIIEKVSENDKYRNNLFSMSKIKYF